MTCPLCKQDETLNHVLKLQRIVEGKNKENLNEIHVCEECANEVSAGVTSMLTFGEPISGCDFGSGESKTGWIEHRFNNCTQLGKNAMLRAESETCQWELEIANKGDVYHTSCGNVQIFICCNVEENNYKYCPYCGRLIKTIDYVPRVEGMCCDCIQPDRHSICGDYSENELCKHRKEDGSCWK